MTRAGIDSIPVALIFFLMSSIFWMFIYWLVLGEHWWVGVLKFIRGEELGSDEFKARAAEAKRRATQSYPENSERDDEIGAQRIYHGER
jgi:hypothetical protein